jgi:hypothetical protein
MDPTLTLVVGCLTVAEKTIKTIHNGWELYTKFQDTGQSVSALVMRLETVDSALTVLQKWLESYLRKSNAVIEMVTCLERAIRGCHMVLLGPEKLVEEVKGATTRERLKYLWNEQVINGHANNLDSQVNALNLVIGIMHL